MIDKTLDVGIFLVLISIVLVGLVRECAKPEYRPVYEHMERTGAKL